MKSLGRAGLLFLFVVVGTLMMVSLAQAAVSSHKINAKGVGQYTPNADFSGGTAETQIIGGGLLHGTTEGITEVVGGDFPVLNIEGTETFTTNKGTLTVPIQGIVNVVTGEYSFSTSPTEWTGTGKLYGATGTLMFEGVQDENGMFVEDITGKIFVDLSPKD